MLFDGIFCCAKHCVWNKNNKKEVKNIILMKVILAGGITK